MMTEPETSTPTISQEQASSSQPPIPAQGKAKKSSTRKPRVPRTTVQDQPPEVGTSAADAAPPKAKAPRKKATRTQASVQTSAGAATEEELSKPATKRAPRAKKTGESKPRATRARKQPAAKVEHEFEPDLDATPVRPREERRGTNSHFADVATAEPIVVKEDAIEPDLDLSPFEPFEPEVDVTPIRESRQLVIPETPALFADVLTPIPETPALLSPELDDPYVTDDLDSSPLLEAMLSPSPDFEVALSPSPGVEVGVTPSLPDEEVQATPSLVPERTTSAKPRSIRGRIALVLLIIIALSTLALWQDASSAHLYLYSIDPLSGQIEAQQDLGNGYESVAGLTNPLQMQSTLFVGLSATQADQQRVLSLAGSSSSWSISNQLQTSLAHATLSQTSDHRLVVSSAGGLQVYTLDGSLLWQTQAEAPTQGVHSFAPALDGNAVYTVKSAHNGTIAAYSLSNGTPLWTAQLNDTLDYAPPFALDGHTLFVASDHRLYAVNTADGSIAWQASGPFRTIFMELSGQPILIAAGAAGLQAFDAQSGNIAWSFNGQAMASTGESTLLTHAQLYQAVESSTNNVIYASGIMWDAQHVREQLWLFAVDATTGNARWTTLVGSDFTSADAGRVLAPYIDSIQGLVMLEVAQDDGSHILSAYDTGNGVLHWSIRLANVTAFAPEPLQLSNSTLGIFSIQSDVGTSLHAWSRLHLLLLSLMLICIVALLGLWVLPLSEWKKRSILAWRAPPRVLRSLYRLLKLGWRRYRVARLLMACCAVGATLIGGIFAIISINRPVQYVNSLNITNGSTQWQQALDTTRRLAGADSQGGLLIKQLGTLSTVTALDARGAAQWSTFASEGSFTVSQVTTPPGTVLITLSGHALPQYAYAPDDPAYTHPLDSLFSLFLLNAATGQVLWQSTVVPGNANMVSSVLGADTHFIYVASRSLPQAGAGQAVLQLSAVDIATGAIGWHVFGPREDAASAPDPGSLLSQGRLLYWQAGSTVIAIDTQLGQIQWRYTLREANPALATVEEAQMAVNGGVLLIQRSDQYHALDLLTGIERWAISSPGVPTAQIPGGILAVGHNFILYAGGVIEAIDASTQAVLWQHTELAGIADVVASQDGTLLYAVVLDNLGGDPPLQSLVALDVNDSAVRWTFQPAQQVNFLYPAAPPLRITHGMLLVTLCQPSQSSACSSQMLYGINGASGSVAWKVAGESISQAQIGQNGQSVVFQVTSSTWENLKARFQG